jgi:hypothetical protein
MDFESWMPAYCSERTAADIALMYLTCRNPCLQEVRNKLSRQLAAANKGATQSRAELAACQAARSEQERRLEAASGQVAAMRAELAALQSRLTARDQQLMAHVQVGLMGTWLPARSVSHVCRNATSKQECN